MGEHPAYPTPVAVPDTGTTEAPVDQPAEPEPPSRAGSRPAARPRVREDAGARAIEKQARTAARDAAWGWAAAARKAHRRRNDWATAMAQARDAGTTPGVLHEYIREAAAKLDMPEHAVPREVFEAAGLEPPG